MGLIAYFTKMYQAVPALAQVQGALGGVFVSTRASTVRAIRQVYPQAGTLRLHERFGPFSAGDRFLKRAPLIVTGSPNRRLLAKYPAAACMVFHGTYAFMTPQEARRDLQHFDLICAVGPRMEETLIHAGLGSRLMVSGYLPFMEFPERQDIECREMLQKLGLNPEGKTLLYLPRGKPHGSWDIMAEKLLRQIPPHYNLIMRPHPSQSVTARIRDKFGFMRLLHLSRQRGNAWIDLSTSKLSTLLSIADLVISDGASSPEESLFYDLPQVFIESGGSSPAVIAGMMRRKQAAEDYIEKLLAIYECGIHIRPDSRNLAQVIEPALHDADGYQLVRQAYFNWVFGEREVERQKQLIRHLQANYAA